MLRIFLWMHENFSCLGFHLISNHYKNLQSNKKDHQSLKKFIVSVVRSFQCQLWSTNHQKQFFGDWCDKTTFTKSPPNLNVNHCAKLSGFVIPKWYRQSSAAKASRGRDCRLLLDCLATVPAPPSQGGDESVLATRRHYRHVRSPGLLFQNDAATTTTKNQRHFERAFTCRS